MDYNSIKNQDIKQKFVAHEVYCNVNTLAEYCLNKSFEDSDAPFSMDDIENYYLLPEYSGEINGEEVYFGGGSEEDREEFINELLDKYGEEYEEQTQNFIDELNKLETEPQDIFEWWAVSSYLYDKLLEQNCCVVEAGSTYLWGRTTTGQAILLDGCISRICEGMEILEGQANEW